VSSFSCTPASTREARSWLRERLDAPNEDAELVLTELSTNAFIHGSPPVNCTVEVGHGELTIRISQPGSADAVRMRDPNPTVPGGRGLQLVDAIATSWGASDDGTTLTVWATLPNPPEQ
jgi:anti-sigma regulatory factor (Ser/Thr protein kinase)